MIEVYRLLDRKSNGSLMQDAYFNPPPRGASGRAIHIAVAVISLGLPQSPVTALSVRGPN